MKLFLTITVFVGLVSTEMAVATTDFLRAHRELAAAACEGCATGSSGPCKASTTVCYKTLADGTCPPNTAFCFPNTADPDVCKNTADYGGLDQGCTTAKPICTSIAKKYIGNDVNGKNCVKCVNVYNDPPNTAGGPRPDFGCPASAPNCVYADGSDVKPFWYAGDTCTSACPLNKLDYTSGFDCPSSASPFKFNGNAKCVGTGTGILRFTEDIDYQVGTAFRPFTFASCNNELTFTWEVDYSITGAGNGDADGLALVMHQDSRGTSAIGGAGGAMGVYEPNSIKKALVIELDTYPNPDLLDAFSDSIHVTTLNGAGAITELADVSFNVRSGTKVKVVYDGTTLKVYMNGSGSPSALAAVDLNSIFTGKSVFVGFAAATGAEGDVHEVSKFTLLG